MSSSDKPIIDQLAKPIFCSRYAHTPESEGPMDTVASKWSSDKLILVPSVMSLYKGQDSVIQC